MIRELMAKFMRWLNPNEQANARGHNPAAHIGQGTTRPANENIFMANPERIGGNRDFDGNTGRDRLIAAEFIAQTSSRASSQMRIVDGNPDTPLNCSEQNDGFTEEGLRQLKTDFLIKTADGRLLKAQDLYRGSACCSCRILSDESSISRCEICRRTVCRLCVREFDGKHYCPEDVKKAYFNYDTWRNI